MFTIKQMITTKNGRYEYNLKRNILNKNSILLKIRKKIRFSMLVEWKVMELFQTFNCYSQAKKSLKLITEIPWCVLPSKPFLVTMYFG